MKPRSWMILILAIGAISLVVGITLVLNIENYPNFAELFNMDPTKVDAFRDFIWQYVTGIPIPNPIT
ncbi:MAG: hypothetical protein KGD59_14280 [Candidatus Heimdallarchaeota archaeon]|nr:hypothetical protein [Candidatus Heimdallarchaeota archaeon]MBY8995715.1 hypothetical protein [Candidatus Heimdallarchaeota archaeon]